MTEAGAVIKFDEEHGIKVKETVDVIAESISEAREKGLPTIRLTRLKGQAVVVNPDQIRTVSEPVRSGGATFH